jgi:endoglycosylceramidase
VSSPLKVFHSLRGFAVSQTPSLSCAEQYNQTYLDQIENIVNELGYRGIYTILDLHQDLLSRYFCGEGIPDWAVLPFINQTAQFPFPMPFPTEFDPQTGYPLLNNCLSHEFALYYPTLQVARCLKAKYSLVLTIFFLFY